MARLQSIQVSTESLDRFDPLLSEAQRTQFREPIAQILQHLHGRVLWNINSTGRGGGVAEMLRSLIAYARGAGLDARWLVMEGNPEFFRITKRLHHALHGAKGDGSPLGAAEREIFEATSLDNSEEYLGLIEPDDLVLLHDPQTAGMVPWLARTGATLLWRSHIGHDHWNAQTQLGWDFLRPYLKEARGAVFSRREYVPDFLADRSEIIPPAIDPFAPKNEALSPEVVRAVLVHTGLDPGTGDARRPFVLRTDGLQDVWTGRPTSSGWAAPPAGMRRWSFRCLAGTR